MKDDDPNQDTIVAIKRCCNRVVFAAVNKPNVADTELRKEIHRLVDAGCDIQHWPIYAVRTAKWGCKCK